MPARRIPIFIVLTLLAFAVVFTFSLFSSCETYTSKYGSFCQESNIGVDRAVDMCFTSNATSKTSCGKYSLVLPLKNIRYKGEKLTGCNSTFESYQRISNGLSFVVNYMNATIACNENKIILSTSDLVGRLYDPLTNASIAVAGEALLDVRRVFGSYISELVGNSTSVYQGTTWLSFSAEGSNGTKDYYLPLNSSYISKPMKLINTYFEGASLYSTYKCTSCLRDDFIFDLSSVGRMFTTISAQMSPILFLCILISYIGIHTEVSKVDVESGRNTASESDNSSSIKEYAVPLLSKPKHSEIDPITTTVSQAMDNVGRGVLDLPGKIKKQKKEQDPTE